MKRRTLSTDAELLVDRGSRGPHLFVDTGFGGDGRSGASWKNALDTIQEAIERLSDMHAKTPGSACHATIHALGDLRGAVTAPLGVYGVKIKGEFFGRPRHTTSGGVYLTGNSCGWREAATAENAPLLKLIEHGWVLDNIIMIPQSGYAAVQLNSNETTLPDASHAEFHRVRFFSSGQVGYGLECVGGLAQIGVYGCWFTGLEYAYKPTSYGIRTDQDHEWFDNRFAGCKTDIAMNATRCEFRRNRHFTAYNASTHPTTLNLANTGGDGNNWVQDVEFADALGDVTIAKGYKPGTGDVWRTREADTAADDVVVPA